MQDKVVIYVLELRGCKFYVGKTIDIDNSLRQHRNGSLSTWTKLHQPVDIDPIIEQIVGDKFDEDKFVLKYMEKFGIENVRGGSYSRVDISDQIAEINAKIRRANDQCIKCGKSGHHEYQCEPPAISPEPVKEIVCMKCDGGDYIAPNCYNTKPIESKHGHTTVCNRCHKIDHDTTSCFMMLASLRTPTYPPWTPGQQTCKGCGEIWDPQLTLCQMRGWHRNMGMKLSYASMRYNKINDDIGICNHCGVKNHIAAACPIRGQITVNEWIINYKISKGIKTCGVCWHDRSTLLTKQ